MYIIASLFYSFLPNFYICHLHPSTPNMLHNRTTGCDDCLTIGFSHFASVVMAMDHFNARDASVVPGLDKLIGPDCPVKFDNSAFFNADPMSHQAAEAVMTRLSQQQQQQQQRHPCAAVGPFDDNVAIELSMLATAMKFPLVVHRAFSLRVLAEYASPYTSQVYPDMISTSERALDLLYYKGRTNYTAFLYALTETGTQWHETMAVVMDWEYMRHKTYAYNSPVSPASGDWTRGMHTTLQRVKESGYRTIVVATEDPGAEVPLMAQAANDLGLTNGDYLWIFIGNAYPPLWYSDDPLIRKLLKGSLHLLPYEAIWYAEEYGDKIEDFPFVTAWRSQGPDFVQRLRDLNPIKQPTTGDLISTDYGFSMTNEGGYVYPEDDFFQKASPGFCSGFIYDAVIATGLGACRALEEEGNATVDAFTRGIRASEFYGASYDVRFGCPESNCFKGERTTQSSVWMVLSPYAPLSNETSESDGVAVTEIIYDYNGTTRVEVVRETYYADGRTVPPDLLRDPPNQNYLSSGLQGFGFALLAVTWLTSVVSIAWVYMHRAHHILRASQPYFLYFVCIGAGLSVSSIFTISFDESDGWSWDQLSRACMTSPWLFSVGFIMMYGGLFGKLWRINQVLQVTRRRIDVKQVAWPSLVLVVLALIILSIWSAIDPLVWEREEIDTETGESIGSCNCDHLTAFLLPLIIVMIIPTFLTGLMAWRTRDVDEEYSESRYIFIMILIQAEVMLFAVPMIAFLRDVSTDARYIGYALILWTFPMSALVMIIGPKVLAYRRATRGGETRVRGSARGSVHVTGINVSPQQLSSGSARHSAPHSGSQTARESHSSNVEEEARRLKQALDAQDS